MLLAAWSEARAATPVSPGADPLPSVTYPSRDPDTRAPASLPLAAGRPDRASVEPSFQHDQGGLWGYGDRFGRFRSGEAGFARGERRPPNRGFEGTRGFSSPTADRSVSPRGHPTDRGLSNVSGSAIVGPASGARAAFPRHGR